MPTNIMKLNFEVDCVVPHHASDAIVHLVFIDFLFADRNHQSGPKTICVIAVSPLCVNFFFLFYYEFRPTKKKHPPRMEEKNALKMPSH